MEDFLGKGWKFPINLNETNNKVDLVAGEDSIRESIMLILGTNKGERVMFPEYGASLNKLAFDTLEAGATAEVIYQVKNALNQWEPRIKVLEVKVSVESGEMNLLNIGVDYEVISSNNRYNLVYPFYMERE